MASAALRDTRRRIKSVDSIKKITRAMELIATSRIPKAVARVEGSKPYTAKLIEVIENVGGVNAGAGHKLLERRDPRTVGVLVVASDRGMAGAYSSNVIRLAEHRIADSGEDGSGCPHLRSGQEGAVLLPLSRVSYRAGVCRGDRHPWLQQRSGPSPTP